MDKKDEKFIVGDNCSILDAMKKINENRSQVVLVITPDNVICGLVTDGDIRRAAINGVKLCENITKAMNKKPIMAKRGTTQEQLSHLAKRHKITHIPIIDDNGKYVEIYFSSNFADNTIKNNLVFILAGGLGTRLGELTINCPKPMIDVGGKPILEHIIKFCMSHGFYRFTISINHLGKQIEDYFKNGSDLGIDVNYIREEKKLGTAGPLGLIQSSEVMPILVINGDVLTNANLSSLLEFHVKSNSSATIGASEYETQIPYGVIEVNDGKVINLLEKPIIKNYISAGIYMIDPRFIKNIMSNQYLDMPDYFKFLIANNQTVSMFPIYEYWQDIGHKNELEIARKKISSINIK